MPNSRNINKADFDNLKTLREKIKFCLRYAVLAPSVHNTQPWFFKILGNVCEVYFDPKLRLAQADATGRNLYISLGKCLENFLIAAKYFGIYDKHEFILTDNLAARIYFNETGGKVYKWERLVDTIPNRVNSRGAFLAKSIPEEILLEIKRLFAEKYAPLGLGLNIITDKEKIKAMALLTAQGMQMANRRTAFRKEMSEWLNNDLNPKKDGMPGFSLRMPFLLSFVIPWLIRFKDLGKFLGKLNYKSIMTAPAVFVFSAAENFPLTWLHMGLAIERLSLELQARGLKTSVYVASVEMGDLYKQVQQLLEISSRPQFVFCAGYMDFNQRLTPKHAVEEKLIN